MSDYMKQIGSLDDTSNSYDTKTYGDWLAFAGASVPYMNAVYRIYTVQLMEQMSTLIGRTTEANQYKALKEMLIDAFFADWVSEENSILSGASDTTVDDAQTALLWALKLGLYKNEEQRDAYIDKLVWSIRNENHEALPDMEENTLAIGFLGVNVLLPVLTEVGQSDIAYDLLLQDKLPSWLYEVKAGATTVWERWNSYSVEDSFLTSNMNSFNHFS